jgi:hypothetical protein
VQEVIAGISHKNKQGPEINTPHTRKLAQNWQHHTEQRRKLPHAAAKKPPLHKKSGSETAAKNIKQGRTIRHAMAREFKKNEKTR